MIDLLSHIDLVSGFFPITSLIVAGCLWGIFQFAIKMKCHPRLSQHFIFMGLCIITCISFIHPARNRDMASPQDSVAGIPADEHRGATVSIDGEGVARLNDFRPDLNRYVPDGAVTETESESQVTILEKIYALFYKDGVRYLYFAGMALVLLHLAFQVLRMKNIRHRCHPESRFNGITLYSSHYTMPFSFGRSIFLPSNQPEETRRYVLLHEESHVRHRHSYKLCLLLFIAAINWYNPFVWLLLSENKLTQEMEADSDAMEQGCIPTEYQMSLLRMSVQNKEWIWIRPAYNLHPLKKRILFMNDAINLKQSRSIILTAFLFFVAVTLFVLGCNTDVVLSSKEWSSSNEAGDNTGTGNALSGSWRLEGTLPDTASAQIYRPKGECYKFYSKGISLTVILYSNNHSDLNAYFNASAETYEILSDSMVMESRLPLKYKFQKPDEMRLTAYHTAGKDSIPDGCSEVWKRTTGIPEAMCKIFRSAVSENKGKHRFKGTWKLVNATVESSQDTVLAAPHVYKIYGDDTYIIFHAMQLSKKDIDYSFEGHFGTFAYISDGRISEKGNELNIEWIDNDHYYLTYFDGTVFQKEKWARTTFPEKTRQIVKGIAHTALP